MTLQSDRDVLDAVRDRYAAGSERQVPELCCPVDYETRYLEVLPAAILERDYGCGDPSRFVEPGDVVLDLGSGAGKICFIASQITGSAGRVIGVDATPAMLELAREHQDAIGERIGWQNVSFRHGHIQDLGLDRDLLDTWLEQHPVRNTADLDALERERTRLRAESPMIADESVDLVLSNCVLNLVDNGSKRALFAEIARVLKRGGRCAISDIVSDEDVPEHMQRDPELWTGCISGAMREDRFLQAFEDAGLYGIEIAAYQTEPWAIVEGIEFRSMTVVAWKGKDGACRDHNEAVIYGGPWKQVIDDDGHVLRRGERTAVCRKTFEIYTGEPYASQITPVPPLSPVSAADAADFDCHDDAPRSARATKGSVERADVAPGVAPGVAGVDEPPACSPSGGCC